MTDKEILEVVEFIKERIPLRLDLRMNDLKYDVKSPYYKVFRYILYLRERIKELEKK